MKNIILCAILYLIFINTIKSQTSSFDWVKQIEGDFYISSITTDVDGNLYTTGAFDGTVYFNTGPSVDSLVDAGFGDIFITKSDSSGNIVWAYRIGGASYDEGKSITIDATGNIYVTGFFNGDSIDFDPGPNVFPMSCLENTFVLKLDGSGNFIWAKQIEGVGENYAKSIALDNQGNILITGMFTGTTDFDPGSGVDNKTSFGTDIYIWKLDSTGSLLWVKQIECISTRSYSIATDGTGNIFVSGLLIGTTDFDPDTTIFNLTNLSTLGSSSIFILKLNPLGNFIWAKKLDNVDGIENDGALVVDSTGGIYSGGYFNGTVDFDPNAGIQNLSGTGNNNYFLLKLDSAGDFSWVNQLADLKGITLDNIGNIYSAGNSIIKFNSNGSIQWMSNNSLSVIITIDKFNNVFSTGSFTGTFDFDPDSGVYNLTGNTTSVFIQKLKVNAAVSVEDLTEGENAIIIFPNPSCGRFYIRSAHAGSYKLVNTFGQIVKIISITSSEINLVDVDELPNGLYFLLKDESNKIICNRITLQR